MAQVEPKTTIPQIPAQRGGPAGRGAGSLMQASLASVYNQQQRRTDAFNVAQDVHDQYQTDLLVDQKAADQGAKKAKRKVAPFRIVAAGAGATAGFLASGGNLQAAAAGAGIADRLTTSAFGQSTYNAYTREGLDATFALKDSMNQEYTAEAVNTAKLVYQGGQAVDSMYGNYLGSQGYFGVDDAGNNITYARHLAEGGNTQFINYRANRPNTSNISGEDLWNDPAYQVGNSYENDWVG